jgi:hypothetical protein
MKILKLALLLLALMSLILTIGCGGEQKATTASTAPTGNLNYPSWYDSPATADYVFVYGMSVNMSESMSQDGAYANAMSVAANYIQAHVESMIKKFEEESGASNPELLTDTKKVIRIVSDAKFSGAQITKRDVRATNDNKIKTFMQVAIPVSSINKEVVKQIHSDEALYNQFKASQAFQELDEQVNKGK